MEHRLLGRTGREVSVVGLGTWQLGADWGDVSDGRSEEVIGSFLRSRPGLTVATKMGRRLAQEPENYTLDNFRSWTDRSRRNLGVDTLDLVQLHCPPSAVVEADRTYDDLDALVGSGAIAAYGVSVETADQALAAIARPNVATIQVILNAFRLKPLDEVLPAAAEAGVGIIARVPLASGLLSGKYDESTTFAADDHRTYNRDGSAFDVGETFSGVDFATGVRAAQDFSALVDSVGPTGLSPAEVALAWVWQQPGVTTVIPGARNAEQARANAAAGDADPLPPAFLDGVRDLYDRYFRAAVHGRW
jgi:aryl-alcohol dehydrogenase-like predicted oxidoreductase